MNNGESMKMSQIKLKVTKCYMSLAVLRSPNGEETNEPKSPQLYWGPKVGRNQMHP